MNHIYDLSHIHLLRPSLVTIGVFDGVHRGHQALIHRLVQEAHSREQLAVVLTFFPHPDIVLRGQTDRYYLMSPDQRAEALLALGVDCVVTQPFNETTRQIRARDFVAQLIRYLKLADLWVGPDFALGYKREGDVAFLKRYGAEAGFSVNVITTVKQNDLTISSTLIRQAVAEGRVEQARAWLGRGYALRGEVVHGKKLGRQIGFPTANIDVWQDQVIPLNGVYAGWAYLGDERFMAMSNVGISPTFDYKGVTVEAYLLDFDRDIYGEILTVTFEHFLRPEAKYNSLDALIAQIGADVEKGKRLLAEDQATV